MSKCLRVQHTDEALSSLDELSTEDTAGFTDEALQMRIFKRWVNLINRGGLYIISDEIYMAFQACSCIEVVLETTTRMLLVKYTTTDGDFQFHW